MDVVLKVSSVKEWRSANVSHGRGIFSSEQAGCREKLQKKGNKKRKEKTYKTIGNTIMFLEHRRSHLGMLMVVVLDEVLIAHAGFLLHEDGGLDHFAETRGISIAGF